MNYLRFPKIELHLHLDCSLSYDAVRQITPDITRNQYNRDFIAPEKCLDLADFLKRAPSGFQLMQTESALRLVVGDLVRQLKQENVLLAEIRFAPLLHTQGSLSAHRVVEIVEDETRKQAADSGIKLGLILATVRRFSKQHSMRTAQLAVDFKGSSVVGFDIAGDEAGYPLAPHIPAFQWVKEHGIPITAHAGEARGPGSIRETLKHLSPDRLGHGIRCIEDPALMEQIRDEEIMLEVCPTCNIQTDIYPDYNSHPVNRLLESGIKLSINTDARTITNITLTEEYQKLADTFHWDSAVLFQTNISALDASFIPESEKSELRNTLQQQVRSLQTEI